MWRKIHTSFWSDPKVRQLDSNGRLLFLYLITNEHGHVSGIYHIPKCLVAHGTGLSEKSVDTLSDTLSRLGLARFDWNFEVVWVKNMLRHQGEGSKVMRAAEIQLASLHNCPLIKDFCSFYPDVKYRTPDRVSDTLFGPGFSRPSGEGEGEEEGDPPQPPLKGDDRVSDEKEQKKSKRGSCLNQKEQALFDGFWPYYPKKVGRGAAEKAFKNTRPTDELVCTMVKALEWQSKSQDWTKNGGQFIPHPTTWLNQRRWEDESGIDTGGNGHSPDGKTTWWDDHGTLYETTNGFLEECRGTPIPPQVAAVKMRKLSEAEVSSLMPFIPADMMEEINALRAKKG